MPAASYPVGQRCEAGFRGKALDLCLAQPVGLAPSFVHRRIAKIS